MKTYKIFQRPLIGFFVIGVIIMIIIGINYDHKGTMRNLEYHFNGVVDSVAYNIKGKATIIVNGSHYDLSEPNWNFDTNRIEKGDSIFKKRNSMIIRLVKPNGQVIVEGEDSK
jgi:hypothetical protein